MYVHVIFMAKEDLAEINEMHNKIRFKYVIHTLYYEGMYVVKIRKNTFQHKTGVRHEPNGLYLYPHTPQISLACFQY